MKKYLALKEEFKDHLNNEVSVNGTLNNGRDQISEKSHPEAPSLLESRRAA
jgi:hypothetical protein